VDCDDPTVDHHHQQDQEGGDRRLRRLRRRDPRQLRPSPTRSTRSRPTGSRSATASESPASLPPERLGTAAGESPRPDTARSERAWRRRTIRAFVAGARPLSTEVARSIALHTEAAFCFRAALAMLNAPGAQPFPRPGRDHRAGLTIAVTSTPPAATVAPATHQVVADTTQPVQAPPPATQAPRLPRRRRPRCTTPLHRGPRRRRRPDPGRPARLPVGTRPGPRRRRLRNQLSPPSGRSREPSRGLGMRARQGGRAVPPGVWLADGTEVGAQGRVAAGGGRAASQPVVTWGQ
jgi:hypothetical protein